MWRVVGDRGQAVLKCHRRAGGWERERDAYHQLAALQGGAIPRLLAAVGPLDPALVLSELPGVPMREARLSHAEQRSVHRQAGEVRARLDEMICDDDPVPLERAYAMRFEHWHTRSRGRVPDDLRRRAAEVFEPGAFAGLHRVACHRDFTPHNWLVERTGAGVRLRVVDLGQARPDVALHDVVKLREDTWLRDPTLGQAFLEGWGRAFDDDDRHRLDLLGLLHGLATAAWAHAHADADLLAHGLDILRRRTHAGRSITT